MLRSLFPGRRRPIRIRNAEGTEYARVRRMKLTDRQRALVARVAGGAATVEEVFSAMGYASAKTSAFCAELNELIAGGALHAHGEGPRRRLGITKDQAEQRYWLGLARGDAKRAAELRLLRQLNAKQYERERLMKPIWE